MTCPSRGAEWVVAARGGYRGQDPGGGRPRASDRPRLRWAGRRCGVATIEEYAQRPREERMARVERTPAELVDAIRGASATLLARRPAPKSWAATEVICHLRDNEEWFLERMKPVSARGFVATNPDR